MVQLEGTFRDHLVQLTESFTFLTFSHQNTAKTQPSASKCCKCLLIHWLLSKCLKERRLRSDVRTQRAGVAREAARPRVLGSVTQQPGAGDGHREAAVLPGRWHECQPSVEECHMPGNTATTSCILYKQFSSLLSSVKCNVLKHLNKINIAVELYLGAMWNSSSETPSQAKHAGFQVSVPVEAQSGFVEEVVREICHPEEEAWHGAKQVAVEILGRVPPRWAQGEQNSASARWEVKKANCKRGCWWELKGRFAYTSHPCSLQSPRFWICLSFRMCIACLTSDSIDVMNPSASRGWLRWEKVGGR